MVKTIRNFEIEIEKDEVYRYLGYGKDQAPSAAISSLIDEMIAEAYRLIQPSGFYRLVGIVRGRKPLVILDDGLRISSELLSLVLSRCQQVAIFVSTIGQRLENRVAQLMTDRQMLRATILDAVGSEAAEKTACYLQDRVRELANSNGAEITLRYSPGYCDWDITQQQVVFEAMDSAPIGVRLTEECLMLPRKSVSGIIGLGYFEKRRLRSSPCRLCTQEDCHSRRYYG